MTFGTCPAAQQCPRAGEPLWTGCEMRRCSIPCKPAPGRLSTMAARSALWVPFSSATNRRIFLHGPYHGYGGGSSGRSDTRAFAAFWGSSAMSWPSIFTDTVGSGNVAGDDIHGGIELARALGLRASRHPAILDGEADIVFTLYWARRSALSDALLRSKCASLFILVASIHTFLKCDNFAIMV